MTDTFIVDYETPNARETSDAETSQILAEIHKEFVKDGVQVRNNNNKVCTAPCPQRGGGVKGALASP